MTHLPQISVQRHRGDTPTLRVPVADGPPAAQVTGATFRFLGTPVSKTESDMSISDGVEALEGFLVVEIPLDANDTRQLRIRPYVGLLQIRAGNLEQVVAEVHYVSEPAVDDD